MTAAPTDPSRTLSKPDGDSWALILKAIGVIATGVGALGFVTLAGAVIEFERFDGLGLPAEHAVAVVPRSDLLVIGGSALVPLVAIFSVSILVMWLIQRLLGTQTEARPIRWMKAKPLGEEVFGDGKGRWQSKSAAERLGLILAAVAGAIGTFGYFAVNADHVPSIGHAIVLVVVVLAAITLGVFLWVALPAGGSLRDSFGWFTIAATILVLVVAAMVNWVLTRESPPARPAVLLTKANLLVEGLYIADTSAAVYLGEVIPKPGGHRGVAVSGRMIEFPRSDVDRLTVGWLQSLRSATNKWGFLAAELEATLPPGTTFHNSGLPLQAPQPR